MKKLILLVAICIPGALACKSAPNNTTQQPKAADNKPVETVKVKAQTQAQELSDAMVAGNYDRAVDLMYPKLVEMAGGKERLRAGLAEQMKQIEIVSIKVGEPHEIIESSGESYALVPSTMSMKVPEGVLVGEGFMIGYSKDKGEHWTFVNAKGGAAGTQQFKTLFPNAPEKLRIPEENPPVLQKSSGSQ